MRLDFAATESGASWSGLLVLVLGLAAAGLIVGDYQHLLASAERIEAELGRLSAPRRSGEPARDARKQARPWRARTRSPTSSPAGGTGCFASGVGEGPRPALLAIERPAQACCA
jgi:hypothetical protein